MTTRARVLAIVGLTGTGKTDLACEVARQTGAEVISADSMQVYRGMDIGTAKPSRELRQEVRHHAIDIVDPDDPMTAGRFAERARAAARDILARGHPVILCGGTGLYARAFAGGLIEGATSDPGVRTELEALPTPRLFEELSRLDPRSAETIPRGDRVRLVRALETHRVTGLPLSQHQQRHGFRDRPFDISWLGLDLERDALWRAIRTRVNRMFDAGLVEEVRGLHARGYGPDLRPLRSIGYLEAGRLLAGGLSEEQAREAVTVATRRYSRRQRTWFKVEPGLRWLDAAESRSALEIAIAEIRGGSEIGDGS